MLVLCAAERQPPSTRFPGVRVIRCPLVDEERPLKPAERAALIRAVREVKSAVTYRKRVLVCCAAGVNRSALVAALAVKQMTGFGPNNVLTLIRERRAWRCLSNKVFEDMIRASGRVRIPKTI